MESSKIEAELRAFAIALARSFKSFGMSFTSYAAQA
jgi:hypothetical protein